MTLSTKQITLPQFLGTMLTMVSMFFGVYNNIDTRMDDMEKQILINKQVNMEQDLKLIDEKESRKETNMKLDAILEVVTGLRVEVNNKADK